MASYKAPEGHGPAPNMPPSVVHAATLPPKITDTHVFFFGYEGEDPHVCFQQWYPSDFTSQDDGNHFPTAEHYMMYHKSLLMSDRTTADKILASSTPAEAKALGREVGSKEGKFNQTIWDENCDQVVEEGNWLKFSQSERLGKVLVGTEGREIIEASPNDKIWGIGWNSEEAMDHVDEWGENKLGKALMRVRERLKRERSGR
ncbi:hypothetical protein LTR04_003622 [Oleoguttula sp. CCFEE 6159]|nr:hypothetical protein LTR04_003622 [Oleoguttula sp. CCFEE 6159]